MSNILIIYSTSYGHTAKVAAFIAGVAREQGHAALAVDAARLPAGFTLEPYDAVFVGGSVIATRHQPALRRFVRRYRAQLARRPTAFFSVSGAAASARPRDQADARRFVRRFLAQTGWSPTQVAIVAGAVCYHRYDLVTRWMIRLSMRRQGGDTDTSRDYEYTDWPALRVFVESFLSALIVEDMPRRSDEV